MTSHSNSVLRNKSTNLLKIVTFFPYSCSISQNNTDNDYTFPSLDNRVRYCSQHHGFRNLIYFRPKLIRKFTFARFLNISNITPIRSTLD